MKSLLVLLGIVGFIVVWIVMGWKFIADCLVAIFVFAAISASAKAAIKKKKELEGKG